MNATDTAKFKDKLLAEKAKLGKELAGIGQKDTSSPGGWDATSGALEIDPADDNEVADKFEELEDNTGIAGNLEGQMADVKAALEKIEKGTYGKCEKCGEPIDMKRLEANPAARTCIEHSK